MRFGASIRSKTEAENLEAVYSVVLSNSFRNIGHRPVQTYLVLSSCPELATGIPQGRQILFRRSDRARVRPLFPPAPFRHWWTHDYSPVPMTLQCSLSIWRV